MVDTSSANRSWIIMIMTPIISAMIAAALVVAFGSGTTGRIPKYTSAVSVGNSDFENNTTGQLQAIANTALTLKAGDVTSNNNGMDVYIIATDSVGGASPVTGGNINLMAGAGGAAEGEIRSNSALSLSGPSAECILKFNDGISAGVGSSGTGVIRYNDTSHTMQYSVNGGAWTDITDTGITQLTGDVTAGPGSGSQAATIANNAVTDAKFRQSGALSVVGRSANSTGNVADIQATAATDYVLRESGSTIGFGTIATGGIANLAVTNAKIANSTIDLTAKVTGVLPAANGGIGIDGSAAANGKIPIGNGSGYTLATITAGSNITVTNGAGSITIASTGGGSGLTKFIPGGRLTLTTATPVTTSNVTAATTVYYALYNHDQVSIYDGSSWTPTTYTELSQATTDATKSPAATQAYACYDMFVWSDSGTMRCTRGPAWLNTATITVTIATPAVVTWNSHGLHEGDPVVFTTSGALPTGITAGTTYFVSRSPTANTFNISTTIANAAAGTLVNTSGSQSGTHTGTNNTTARGTGSGTTELERVSGIWMNKYSITNGPNADRGVYVGTIYMDSANQATDSDSKRHVWNYYNRVNRYMYCFDTTSTWTYSTATMRAANASTTTGTGRVECVIGLQDEAYSAVNITTGSASSVTSGYACNVNIGINSTNVGSAALAVVGYSTTSTTGQATYNGYGVLGFNVIQRTEIAGGSATSTYFGDNGLTALQTGMKVELRD